PEWSPVRTFTEDDIARAMTSPGVVAQLTVPVYRIGNDDDYLGTAGRRRAVDPDFTLTRIALIKVLEVIVAVKVAVGIYAGAIGRRTFGRTDVCAVDPLGRVATGLGLDFVVG